MGSGVLETKSRLTAKLEAHGAAISRRLCCKTVRVTVPKVVGHGNPKTNGLNGHLRG